MMELSGTAAAFMSSPGPASGKGSFHPHCPALYSRVTFPGNGRSQPPARRLCRGHTEMANCSGFQPTSWGQQGAGSPQTVPFIRPPASQHQPGLGLGFQGGGVLSLRRPSISQLDCRMGWESLSISDIWEVCSKSSESLASKELFFYF